MERIWSSGLPAEKLEEGLLKKWVTQELERKNVVPLLKVVWLEWFGLPLSVVGRMSDQQIEDFKYKPYTDSGCTEVEEVERIIGALDLSDEHRNFARSFIQLRRFLEGLYGEDAD